MFFKTFSFWFSLLEDRNQIFTLPFFIYPSMTNGSYSSFSFFLFLSEKKTNFKIFIFLFWLLLHTIQPTFFTLSTKKSSSDKIEIKPKQIFERNSGKKPLQIQPKWMKIMFRKKNDPFDLSLFVVAYQKKNLYFNNHSVLFILLSFKWSFSFNFA